MLEPEAPLYQVLYTSRLAPDVNISQVASIARRSRQRNEERGISGTLLFDGQRFCHYFEGAPDAVRALAARIAQDPRHTGFTVRHEGPFAGARLFARWALGYSLVQDAQALDVFDAAFGVEAIGRLREALLRCWPEP